MYIESERVKSGVAMMEEKESEREREKREGERRFPRVPGRRCFRCIHVGPVLPPHRRLVRTADRKRGSLAIICLYIYIYTWHSVFFI